MAILLSSKGCPHSTGLFRAIIREREREREQSLNHNSTVSRLISDGYSSKLFSLTPYLSYVKQPIQENRFENREHKVLYISDGLSSSKH